jgi:hypothetical protein
MTSSEERVKILKMVEVGKLSPEEAAQLLGALGKARQEGQRATGEEAGESRWLRVRVSDLTTGRPKVNVTIPMRLVNVGLRVGARFIPEVEGVELQDLSKALAEGMTGKLIDVVDEDENERVEIFAD